MNTTNATQTAPQMMTARELAQLTKLNAETIRRAAKKNLIPSQKLGGAIRFSPEQVEAIMRDGFALPKKTN